MLHTFDTGQALKVGDVIPAYIRNQKTGERELRLCKVIKRVKHATNIGQCKRWAVRVLP